MKEKIFSNRAIPPKLMVMLSLLVSALIPLRDLAGSASKADPAGTVAVYPPLPGNQYMSDRYQVSVVAGGISQSSYVYKDPNNDPRWRTLWPASEAHMTLENHFTSFSFSGSVEVQVKLPMRSAISGVIVRPLSKKLTVTVKDNIIFLRLSQPGNLYLEVDGEKRFPLFIFANPPEEKIPSPGDTNVIYFAPGIHDIGYKDGPMQRLSPGKCIYIAGGAYVKGVFKTTKGRDTTTVRGRGILSGIDIPGYSAYNGMIDVRNGTLDAEGIIINDAPQGYQGAIAFGRGSVLHNVKMIAWAMESDAGILGIDSRVTGCFFKINDDVLKPVVSGLVFENNTVWQQMCGAVIMLGWNNVNDVTGARVSGVDVIGCDVGEVEDPTATTLGIINMKNSNGGSYRNIIIEDIRIEKRPYLLFGLDIKQTERSFVNDARYNKGLGAVDGIIFRNISLPLPPVAISYFNGNGNITPQSSGDIKNVTFEHITITETDTRITQQNAGAFIDRRGKTSNFIFQ